MSYAIRRCINAYIHMSPLKIKIPSASYIEDEYIPRQIQLIVKLDENKDKEIINWIKSIRTGYRNSFIKNLIRSYLSAPVAYIYMPETSWDLVNKNTDVFEKDNISATKIPKRKITTKKRPQEDIGDMILKGKKEKEKSLYVENIDDVGRQDENDRLADKILSAKETTPKNHLPEEEKLKEEDFSKDENVLDQDEADALLDQLDKMMGF